MFKTLIASFAVFLLMLSCGGSEHGVTGVIPESDTLYADSIEMLAKDDTLELFEEEVLPESADELFDDFFFNYASDATFRKSRTRCGEQVAVDSAYADSVISGGAFRELSVRDFYTVIYEREDELAFQKDTSLTEVVVERVDLDSGAVEQFVFKRNNGMWIMCEVASVSVDDTPNADFMAFYSSFSADTIECLNSVAKPLRFVMSADDSDEDEVVELELSEWAELSSDLPLPSRELINVNYGQTCISNNNKLLLVVGVSNGLSLRYRFMKQGGKWMLVEVVI